MAPHPFIIIIIILLPLSLLTTVHSVGVNWGTAASHPLPPPLATELLRLNNFTRVKLLEPDPLVLESLSGSNVHVTVGIPNRMLRELNSSEKAAKSWVHDNLTRYVSDKASGVVYAIQNAVLGFLMLENNIVLATDPIISGKKSLGDRTNEHHDRYIAVGDEPFLESYGEQFHPFILGATINIQTALISANLANKVKVIVPCSSDTYISESGLPSKGHFRSEINKTMIELLYFLSKHHSPFIANISPFLNHLQNKNISLDFALFKESAHHINDSKKTYQNSFDLTYDTLVTALSSVGFSDMDIIVGKIGWPTDGSPNATSSVAQIFMKNLMEHLHSKSGTPLRPHNPPIEIYIYTLLDEDQQSIDPGNFERHWGIFTFDGQAKYQVDFGQGSKNLTNALNVEYLGSKWCVVNNNKDLSNANAKAVEACSVADCSSLSLGGSCFNISWPGNISYAFNSYYQQHDQRAESCDFGGLGLITTVDPSVESCRFSVELKSSRAVSLSWFILFYFAFLLVAILPLC